MDALIFRCLLIVLQVSGTEGVHSEEERGAFRHQEHDGAKVCDQQGLLIESMSFPLTVTAEYLKRNQRGNDYHLVACAAS